MRLRPIISLLCLLFLGGSTLLAAVHHHGKADAFSSDRQCAACSWHYNATSDVPVTTTILPVPDQASEACQTCDPLPVPSDLPVHPSRGPPSFLL